MSVPPPLVFLVHGVLSEHYRKHHRDLDANHAEAFASTFLEKLFGPDVTAEAGRAVKNLDIQELIWITPDAEEKYRLADILQKTLCREIQHWLRYSGIWRYSVELKALAYARVVAGAADAGMYAIAVQNAKLGLPPTDDLIDDLPEHERAAHEEEARYSEGQRRW